MSGNMVNKPSKFVFLLFVLLLGVGKSLASAHHPSRRQLHKVALAGGSGQLGRTLIDSLVQTKKHDIVILSRRDPSPSEIIPGATWKKVDYQNTSDIALALRGVDTVLSFIIVCKDPGDKAQRNLIDASIQAGVKRFAPSEWSNGDVSSLSWYVGKQNIRDYLAQVNERKKVLEYTLFQPGLMMEYYTWPHVFHKYIKPLQIPIDFDARRAIVVQDQEFKERITFTSVEDVVHVVTKALEYNGRWPIVGGIRGNKATSTTNLVALGEKIRGKRWTIDKLKLADVEAGVINSTWIPMPNHNSVANMTQEEKEAFGKVITRGMLLSFGTGAWSASDEWNQLVAKGHRFKSHESFLRNFWKGRL